jgi:hypothetical protein
LLDEGPQGLATDILHATQTDAPEPPLVEHLHSESDDGVFLWLTPPGTMKAAGRKGGSGGGGGTRAAGKR